METEVSCRVGPDTGFVYVNDTRIGFSPGAGDECIGTAPLATVEIVYTDGTVARWSMSNGDADKLANLIGRSPDTIRT